MLVRIMYIMLNTIKEAESAQYAPISLPYPALSRDIQIISRR